MLWSASRLKDSVEWLDAQKSGRLELFNRQCLRHWTPRTADSHNVPWSESTQAGKNPADRPLKHLILLVTSWAWQKLLNRNRWLNGWKPWEFPGENMKQKTLICQQTATVFILAERHIPKGLIDPADLRDTHRSMERCMNLNVQNVRIAGYWPFFSMSSASTITESYLIHMNMNVNFSMHHYLHQCASSLFTSSMYIIISCLYASYSPYESIIIAVHLVMFTSSMCTESMLTITSSMLTKSILTSLLLSSIFTPSIFLHHQYSRHLDISIMTFWFTNSRTPGLISGVRRATDADQVIHGLDARESTCPAMFQWVTYGVPKNKWMN